MKKKLQRLIARICRKIIKKVEGKPKKRKAGFDIKEEKMLQHYKWIIENRMFDEYDILGFLIFIRRHLSTKKYEYIRDFSDLIAHRERDKGIVVDCILACIENNYAIDADGKSLKDYHGIDMGKWDTEWRELGNDFCIGMNADIIKEITLCIFSLSQHTQHVCKGGISGTIKLLFTTNDFICLVTAENRGDAQWVCFAKCGSFVFDREYTKGYLKKPVETKRENGILRLFDEDGYII